nr:33 kDa chaperonin [Ipomoea batatas]
MFRLSCLVVEAAASVALTTSRAFHWGSVLHWIKEWELEMVKGMIWATAEDMARNRGRVLSLYRQILRSLNSPILPLNLAARLQKKAEARAMFLLGAEERSLHNIEDLIDAAEYTVSLLKKGELPKHILV